MPALTCRRADARPTHGFTLVELALVLAILALLGSSLLAPLASRIEARDRQLARDGLRDAIQALTGFALIHGRLPCASTAIDPASSGHGLEDSAPCAYTAEGQLPWRTLGLPAGDAWAQPWRYRVDPRFAEGSINVATLPGGKLQIRAHDGSAITTSESQAVAIVYSTGANRRADGLNAHYSANAPSYQSGEAGADFDDILAWIGRPLLIARLAQAGRL